MAPRTLAIAGAAVLVLILLVFLFSRAASPASTPEPTAVPALAVASPTAPAPAVAPTQGPIQATVVPVEPSYTVQSGDTLAIIARRFNTSVDAIVSINNLTDRNSLRVGQRLVIPNQ